MNFLGKVRQRKRHTRASTDADSSLECSDHPRTTLLTLPAELRLQIFEDVFAQQSAITLHVGADVALVDPLDNEPLTGKPGSWNSVGLLQVCRQIHVEAKGLFYKRTLFMIASSLHYEKMRHRLYLKPMPNGLVPLSTLQQIRRLLLVVDLGGGFYWPHYHRMGNLTYLQAMTNLREIRVIFPSPNGVKVDDEALNGRNGAVRSIVECIPKAARISFGGKIERSEGEAESEEQDVGGLQTAARNADHPFDRAHTTARSYVLGIAERKGVLSGSRVDHTLCTFGACKEGKGCVNSEFKFAAPKKAKRPLKAIKSKANKKKL